MILGSPLQIAGVHVVGSNVDLLAFAVIGLLAGAHCLGMCGPLVTMYADRIDAQTETRRRDTLTPFAVRQHALFNLGRTLSYATIGGLAAAIGGLLFASVGSMPPIERGVRTVAGLAVGIVIIAAGIQYLLGGTGTLDRFTPGFVGATFQQVSGLLTARVDSLVGSPRIVALGAIHGLLPCPILYPAYVYAFVIGDPVRGALSLGILGLGTVPTLFAYGTLLGSLDDRRRRTLHRMLGAAFLLLGYIPLSHGLILLGIHVPHVPVPFYQPLVG
ncbi:MAG: sulfite exporter TauE/SafE family protein [Halorientalis sp.]